MGYDIKHRLRSVKHDKIFEELPSIRSWEEDDIELKGFKVRYLTVNRLYGIFNCSAIAFQNQRIRLVFFPSKNLVRVG